MDVEYFCIWRKSFLLKVYFLANITCPKVQSSFACCVNIHVEYLNYLSTLQPTKYIMIPNCGILQGTISSCLFSQNFAEICTNQPDFLPVNEFFFLHLYDPIDFIHARISVVRLDMKHQSLHIDVYVRGRLTDILSYK